MCSVFNPLTSKTETGALFEELCYSFVIITTLDDGQIKKLRNAKFLYTPPSGPYSTECIT